jgi:NADH:ubiquinone oxidoreductase subunit F (NADH-binding)
VATSPFKAALLGGAAGTFVDASMLDERMTYDNLREKEATLGSGAVMVMEEGDSVYDMLHNCLRFFKHESCGKCVPCRVGTSMLVKEADKLRNACPTKKPCLTKWCANQRSWPPPRSVHWANHPFCR